MLKIYMYIHVQVHVHVCIRTMHMFMYMVVGSSCTCSISQLKSTCWDDCLTLALICMGDFGLTQLSCLSSLVGKRICLECRGCGLESHLSFFENDCLVSCIVLLLHCLSDVSLVLLNGMASSRRRGARWSQYYIYMYIHVHIFMYIILYSCTMYIATGSGKTHQTWVPCYE